MSTLDGDVFCKLYYVVNVHNFILKSFSWTEEKLQSREQRWPWSEPRPDRRGPGGNVKRGTHEHSGELVQHPVLRRCDALQVLLRSSCLEGEEPAP